LGLESPTIIPIIDKLEKDGFVNRMVDKNDRRNNQIFLTEKTTSLLDSIINYTLKINEISIMNVSEQDISITKHTLEKMWQNIQNEFNLNHPIDNKRKRYSTAAQGIGINTNIQ
jgi:MarR family transcriptional regulator, transcriptional regulator for hemolysin